MDVTTTTLNEIRLAGCVPFRGIWVRWGWHGLCSSLRQGMVTMPGSDTGGWASTRYRMSPARFRSGVRGR